jgi:hypothetical protein
VAIAYVALILTLPATLVAFALLPPTRAALLILFGGLLFLPEKLAFDAPLIPPLDKHAIVAMCLMIGVLLFGSKSLRRARPGRGIDILLLLSILIVPVGRVLTNSDTLHYGPLVISGLALSDILSLMLNQLLGPCIVFFLGRTLFRTTEEARSLLRALVFAALVYVPFCLVELRFSPQWHVWIYGFRQSAFNQSVRGGSYRPMVFMAHGLALAMLCLASVIAAVMLAKARVTLSRHLSPRKAALGLGGLLAVLSSAGALIYGIVSVPMLILMRAKMVLRIACFLACIVAIYPVLRATDVFPSKALVDFAARFSHERASSLRFRFENEDVLLKKALERPLFGWGWHGRNRVYDRDGLDQTVTDGAWIVTLGYEGVVGLVFQFALLLIPIFLALARVDQLENSDQALLAGTALITVFYALDLLPNGMFNDLPMFFSGALTGLSQGLSTQPRSRINPALVAQLLNVLRRASARPSLRAH